MQEDARQWENRDWVSDSAFHPTHDGGWEIELDEVRFVYGMETKFVNFIMAQTFPYFLDVDF